MCREALPPGADQLFEEACRLYMPVEQRIERRGRSWGSMSRKDKHDLAKAAKLWLGAADQGHAAAQTNLGLMYKNGRGVAQSDKEAVRWYRLAADQGYAVAQFNLGFMYKNGRGVAQDYKTALAWFRKSAAQGDENAVRAIDILENEIS